ncbi:auxin response factor [Trifolium repens]|nr:auxin response factor [Trifolium repens]
MREMDYVVVKDNLSAQLWCICNGSVYIPKIGEKVLYFPQGHMEQVAIYHQQESNFGLPWKILCLVINVQLKVVGNTDKLLALVTLIPLQQQELMVEDNHPPHDDSPNEVYSFSKMLTSTEASTHAAGIYIPKEHAERCFPPLDMTVQPPMQDLVVKDLHGIEWNFRHIYCDHQRAHFLTSGWSTFVNSKKLVPGDSCIFARGENGEIGIGIRRAMKQHSDILKTSSPLGAMCVASHAVSTGTMFLVQYYPWIAPFEFMIPLKTYVESVERDYFIGMRVHNLYEVEGSAKRYGTIVGSEDIDPIRWPGSEWRCIKVQWDSIPPNTSTQLERVCPWWIEPLGSSKIKGFPKDIGSSTKAEYHTVDMEVQGQQHYNTRNVKTLNDAHFKKEEVINNTNL